MLFYSVVLLLLFTTNKVTLRYLFGIKIFRLNLNSSLNFFLIAHQHMRKPEARYQPQISFPDFLGLVKYTFTHLSPEW